MSGCLISQECKGRKLSSELLIQTESRRAGATGENWVAA